MFINEPRLSDFKQVLLREGIQAEFVGGVLVCNNMVAVRRVSVLPPGSLSLLSISFLQNYPILALYMESGQLRSYAPPDLFIFPSQKLAFKMLNELHN